MRSLPRTSGLATVVTLSLLWSLPAASMMATDGPPPCETTECFVDAVAACKADASYMTRAAAGAMVQYRIEGEAEGGDCQLGMIYMMHPNNAWTYQPVHFVVSRDGNIEAQLKDTVAECLSETADEARQCRGPLLDLIGTADE